MTEEDKERMLNGLCKAWDSNILNRDRLLAVAKAAREFRETGELRNGDEVQVYIHWGWEPAKYIGRLDNKVVVYVTNCGHWTSIDNIRPKPKTELRVKGVAALAKALEDGGWEPGANGVFVNHCAENFYASMWQYCGMVPPEKYSWHKDWLEEVEI